MKVSPMLNLIILLLIVQLSFSFFGQSVFPDIPHSGGFIYILSFVLFSMIMVKFLILMFTGLQVF
jgi:hypothetical protein